MNNGLRTFDRRKEIRNSTIPFLNVDCRWGSGGEGKRRRNFFAIPSFCSQSLRRTPCKKQARETTTAGQRIDFPTALKNYTVRRYLLHAYIYIHIYIYVYDICIYIYIHVYDIYTCIYMYTNGRAIIIDCHKLLVVICGIEYAQNYDSLHIKSLLKVCITTLNWAWIRYSATLRNLFQLLNAFQGRKAGLANKPVGKVYLCHFSLLVRSLGRSVRDHRELRFKRFTLNSCS